MTQDTYIEAIKKVANGEIAIKAMRRVVADPDVKLPIGFYKECRANRIYLHSKQQPLYDSEEEERMYQ